MKKKIYITGCSGIPARYGGFETFTENIARELTIKYEISVICSSKLYHITERTTNWKSINRIFYNIKPNGAFSILYDWKGLIKAAREADYILQLGVGAGMIL